MHIQARQTQIHNNFRRLAAVLFAFSVAIGSTHWAQADFSGNGDIVGTVDNGGNTTSPGDLIVGDTGTAGVFGDGALPLVGGDLNPLRSDQSILGNEERSIGAMTFEDFLFLPGETDPRGGNWLIDEGLTLGNNGQGYLDLLNSARVEVAEDVWIGGGDDSGALQTATGEGYGLLTINGAGTRFVTGDGTSSTQGFYVGFNGVGDVEVSGRGSIETLGFAVIGEEDGANGQVTLTDRGTRWTVDLELTVGNGEARNTTAYGTLHINNDARVLVKDNVFVNSRGTIQLAGGNLELLDPASDRITSNGKIAGYGFIDGPLTLQGVGVLSNRALGADQREHLEVGGVVTNDSLIESFGGEMTFHAAVTNNQELVARDAIMTFNGGFANSSTGAVVLGGATTIHTISAPFASEGQLHVLAGSEATIVGDLALSGGILALTVGEDAGTLDVIGAITLSGAELELEYSAGVFSQPGDTYEILDATDPISNMFTNAGDQVTDDNGRVWDIIYNASSVWVTATSTVTSTTLLGDFDSDSDVDGVDFLSWQRGGSPNPLSAGDLADWRANYGATGPLSAVSAVPEPSTLVLALLTLVCCPRRRRIS